MLKEEGMGAGDRPASKAVVSGFLEGLGGAQWAPEASV